MGGEWEAEGGAIIGRCSIFLSFSFACRWKLRGTGTGNGTSTWFFGTTFLINYFPWFVSGGVTMRETWQ